MSQKKIMMIENEEKICEMVVANLEAVGYDAVAYQSPTVALEHFKADNPDLLLLDLMLPDMTGEEVCAYIRTFSQLPILMLTAKVSEEDLVGGFGAGADDYVKKPFSIKELLVRIEALLKRNAVHNVFADDEITAFGDYVINHALRIVYKNGQELLLTSYEYRIIEVLASRPGKIWTREELISVAFHDNFNGYDRAIDGHIKNIRKKLGDSSLIKTIYGLGYKLEV